MSFRPILRRSLRALCGLAVSGAVLLTACGGGGSDSAASAQATASPALPLLSTAPGNATVVMPAGVGLGADKVSVITSVDSATPAASGAVTLTSYVNGPQLAIVLSPAGNPMLMGWIDATHTTISAATTAQVLAYFALNGALMLNDAERQALIADLPGADGIGALEAAVQSELAANVDAFAGPDAVLTQAVSSFATPYYVNAQAGAAAVSGRAKALGISITPSEQSGITVLQDPPFAAHLSNSFRRRSFAFVDRISHTTAGVDVADPLAVTKFEVPPVVGVNGGVTGALTDIMSAYYGNQPTAYGSIDAPDGGFKVPLVDGSDKTTYQVTVVGPGVSAGVAASLTAEQSAQLTDIALRGFVKDFMVPTMANGILGSGVVDFKAGQGTANAQFFADVLASVTTDFIAYLGNAPTIRDKIVKGQWFDAGVDITSTVAGSGAVRTMLIKGFDVAVANASAAGVNFGPTQGLLTAFNKYMNAAGGVLQAFDSTLYIKDLANSDQADQWSVVVVAEKVALNPPASNIDVGGTVLLKASVLGVEDTSGYSYHWTTTTQVGDLTEIGGLSRLHEHDFCSNSSEAQFVYKIGAKHGATDTVTVQVYSGTACDPTRGTLLGSKSATVAFDVTTVNVALRQPWTDTGLAVVPGQQLTITTAGTMNYWTGGCPSTQNCVVTPDGLPWSVCEGSTAGPYLTPGLACFSLVGRFGANGTPFQVGSNLTVTVPATASGEFFLGVNDNYYGDNSGSWVATIK